MRKVSQVTISALEKIITGNPLPSGQVLAPYQTATELGRFFKQFGISDLIGNLSRKDFTENKLEECNGKDIFVDVVEKSVDIRRFYDSEHSLDDAVQHLNTYLKFDGLLLQKVGETYRLKDIHDLVQVKFIFRSSPTQNHDFINEQLRKCEQKIENRDYDGAITNARALIEAILIELEKKYTSQPSTYDGDLLKLYKRVQKLLNLDPSEKSISDSLRQVLSGLTSIVNGLSTLRNKMSDAHARQYKPLEHHAKLTVNSARTIANFLFETYEYQQSKKV